MLNNLLGQKILCFFALDFTSGFHPEIIICNNIIVIQFLVFGKVAEEAGKFQNVAGITVLQGDQYFSEKVIGTSSSRVHLNFLFKTT